VLIGAGGHVMGALVMAIAAIPGLDGRVDLHLSRTLPGGRAPVPPDVLARAAVLLEEAAPWQSATSLTAAERALLPQGCTTITLPRPEFNSLWPLMADDPRNVATPELPMGPIPRLFADRLASHIAQAEPDPDLRRAAYDATRLDSIIDLQQGHEAELRQMFLREQSCNIRIAAFVLSQFRAQRLFHTAVHPAGPVLHYMMAQILAHPTLPDLLAQPYDTALRTAGAALDDAFSDIQAPIHPRVAAHFALAWWNAGLEYRWLGQGRRFSDWIEWYLRLPAPSPATPQPATEATIPAGLPLGTGDMPGAIALHPPAEIARVAPFFATAIDPAIARHGAALLSEASARYRAAPAMLGMLAGATILGDSGAVLHQQAIVANTLRENADSLRTTLLPARRHLDGRHFMGFGPHWRDDPHGITGVLPRLVAYARRHRRDPALRLLLPEAADAPWLRETLALLNINATQVAWLADEAVVCADLTLTTRLPIDDVAPFAIEAARAAAALVPLSPPGPRLVYLHGDSTCGTPANATQIAATLAARGFAIVEANRISLPERIALLRHATAVVAAQGPHLAGMVFCPPGTAVLELVGPANPRALYWSLASCAGLRYGYVVGEPTGPAPGLNDSYTVPLAMLAYAAGIMRGASPPNPQQGAEPPAPS